MFTIILGILGVIGYLYLSWRTLRDNYRDEDIVAFSWVALLLFLIGGRLAFGFWHWGAWTGNFAAWFEFWKLNEINMLGGTLLWLAFALLITRDKKWKLLTFLEDSLISLGYLLVVLGIILKNWLFIIALVGAGILTLAIKDKYRSLFWYKSGKKGFLFFWFLAWFCLIFSVVSGIWWLSGLSLLFGLGLFILGHDKFSK